MSSSPRDSQACLLPLDAWCLVPAVLHEHRPQLPTNMLALMTELEKQGPLFATKMLITVVGELCCRSWAQQWCGRSAAGFACVRSTPAHSSSTSVLCAGSRWSPEVPPAGEVYGSCMRPPPTFMIARVALATTPRSSLLLLLPVRSLAGSDDRGLVYQTDAEASVLTAIRDFFLGQPGGGALVHRLAIFDAHGDITRIVSQMDVLK